MDKFTTLQKKSSYLVVAQALNDIKLDHLAGMQKEEEVVERTKAPLVN